MSGQATITIGSKTWTVALATTPEELVRGLGGLASIPTGTGMLFDMGQEQSISVTTVPMLFPLDIVFFNSALIVNGIALNVAPGYLVTTEALARYFLELNAGEGKDISKGQQATVQVLATPAQPSMLDQAIPLLGSMFALALGLGVMGAALRISARSVK